MPTADRYLFETALGPCRVSWGPAGLTRIELPTLTDREARAETQAQGARTAAQLPPNVRAAVAALQAHLGGRPQDFSGVQLDLTSLPPFARAVTEALRTLPAGRTETYGALAARAGRPGGARAIGQVLGKNPFLVAVPCHRVLAAGGKPGGFSAPGVLATKVKLLSIEGVRLASAASMFEPDAPGAGLLYDPAEATRALGRADRDLAALIARVGPYRMRPATLQSPFEALAESIVYQQLTGRAAATILGRVKALFPGRFPRPAQLLDAPEDSLRAAGLSRAKVAALRDLAAKTLDGTVPTLSRLRKMSDDEIVERLTEVRGIGRWTVEMLLLFRLGRPDVLPATDYGVRKAFAQLYGLPELPAPAALLAHGEKWRPYRSVASWYLWRLLDPP